MRPRPRKSTQNTRGAYSEDTQIGAPDNGGSVRASRGLDCLQKVTVSAGGHAADYELARLGWHGRWLRCRVPGSALEVVGRWLPGELWLRVRAVRCISERYRRRSFRGGRLRGRKCRNIDNGQQTRRIDRMTTAGGRRAW